MADAITLTVNGAPISVHPGTTVAAAMVMCGTICRKSTTGEPRGPLCGMGICFECRAVVNGTTHCRACQILCEPGMDVRTNE